MSSEHEEKQSAHESEPMLEHKDVDTTATNQDEMIEQDLGDDHKARAFIALSRIAEHIQRLVL